MARMLNNCSDAPLYGEGWPLRQVGDVCVRTQYTIDANIKQTHEHAAAQWTGALHPVRRPHSGIRAGVRAFQQRHVSAPMENWFLVSGDMHGDHFL